MRARGLVHAFSGVLSLASLVSLASSAACGSVPDLVFVDDGPTGDAGDGAAPTDARPDGPASEAGACVASGSDVCCGARLCRNCSPSNCAECEACNETAFCCGRPNGVQCRSGGTCN